MLHPGRRGNIPQRLGKAYWIIEMVKFGHLNVSFQSEYD
jgi:hypothetical protein